MTNNNNTTLYTGVTSDLKVRVYQHKNNLFPESFTAKYKIHKLVYFEAFNPAHAGLKKQLREKSSLRAVHVRKKKH